MFLNLKMLNSKNLTLDDFLLLTLLYQSKSQDTQSSLKERMSEAKLEEYKKLDLIKTLKNGELRLSPKGLEVLSTLTSDASIEEEDILVQDWLAKHFRKLGKEVGNQKKTKLYIALFRLQSGISKNNLIKLCKDFVDDEKNMEYSHRLEYMFFKPPSAFATRFDLEESRLWKFYLRNKEYYDNKFEEA
jgi:hypothetical protein